MQTIIGLVVLGFLIWFFTAIFGEGGGMSIVMGIVVVMMFVGWLMNN